MGVANDRSIAWGIAKKLSEQGYKFDVITSQTLDARANELRRENLQTHFGDVFNKLIFLDQGADKLETLRSYPKGTFWIEDKPANAELGHDMGLVALLLDLPHNTMYNEGNSSVQRVENWAGIYNVIKEKQHGNS